MQDAAPNPSAQCTVDSLIVEAEVAANLQPVDCASPATVVLESAMETLDELRHVSVTPACLENAVSTAADDLDAGSPWYDPIGFHRRFYGFDEGDAVIREALLHKYGGWRLAARIDHYFEITRLGSSFTMEVVGGSVTFFSMAYILALNPIIVSGAIGADYKASLFVATAASSGIFTLLMGIAVNVPVALAPGMGLNGFFANVARVSSGVLVGTLPAPQCLGAVFVAGCLYLTITYSGLRYLLFSAVPSSLRHAISVGIGLFIALIGFKIGSVMNIHYYGGPISTDAPKDLDYTVYDINQKDLRNDASLRMTVVGLLLMTVLLTLRVRGGILIAILVTTVVSLLCSGSDSPTTSSSLLSASGSTLAGKLEFGAIGKSQFWEVTWTFLFVEMFDSFGTIGAVMARGHFGGGNRVIQERLISNAMKIDGWGTLLGSLMGSNTITIYVESLTGVASGAKTGFASVVTGVYFLLALLFLYPVIALIPNSAVVPALFAVGAFSLESVRHIDLEDPPTMISAFVIIATMPFTYSIANGIAAGFIFYNVALLARFVSNRVVAYRSSVRVVDHDASKSMWEAGWNRGDPRDVIPHPAMMLMGVFFVVRYALFFS